MKGYSQITKMKSKSSLQMPQQEKNIQIKNYRTRFLIFTLVVYCLLGLQAYLTPSSNFKVVIIGTNDLHGQAFPTSLLRSDNNQLYNYGGLVYMANMIKTIKQENNNNVLYLDAGDQFQGGIQSSKLVSSGQIMNDFFKTVGLTGSTIGNHEFDFGPQFLLSFLKGRQTPNLAANLRSQKGQENFLPFHKNSQLFALPNGIKIGVIGLVTLQTLTTTAGFSSNLFPKYKFLQYKDVVIRQSKKLKQQGAHAVIIVSHVGDACSSNVKNEIRNDKSQQSDCPPDQLNKLIASLPQGTVHGIVQGHRHRFAHHYFKGVPYMGSINGGYYFNIMQLTFNAQKQLISTNIQGPIPVCEKIFQNLKRCDYIEPSQIQKAGKLINWQFHNKTVKADPQLSNLLTRKYKQKMDEFQQQIVYTQIKLARSENQQSQLSNLFTTLMHEAAKDYSPDFSFINTGAFRTQWTPGVIKYKHYYNMFPFQNDLQIFDITGKDLIGTLQVIESGRRWIQAWNIQIQVQIDNTNRTKKLIKAKFMDGRQIQQNKIYRGVTLSYLVDGGDQFSKAKGKQFNPTNIQTLGDFRQLIKKQLKKVKIIKKGSFKDPNNPRIIVHVKP